MLKFWTVVIITDWSNWTRNDFNGMKSHVVIDSATDEYSRDESNRTSIYYSLSHPDWSIKRPCGSKNSRCGVEDNDNVTVTCCVLDLDDHCLQNICKRIVMDFVFTMKDDVILNLDLVYIDIHNISSTQLYLHPGN